MDTLHKLMAISREKDMSLLMRLHMLKALMMDMDENDAEDRTAIAFVRAALIETRTSIKKSGVRYAN